MGSQSQKYHKTLAEYFQSKDYFFESVEEQRTRSQRMPPTPRPVNYRKVEELAYQRLSILQTTPMATHLYNQVCEDLENLLTDIFFIEAKTEAGMLFDLVADFGTALQAIPTERIQHWNLSLLEEAIGRDISFIARHPTTLFQCLWNNCWWYDSPERMKHCVHNREQKVHLASEFSGPKLWELMERWRNSKEHHTPGFTWLRDLRPPHLALSSPLRFAVNTEEPIQNFRISADGAVITTAGFPTKETWDPIFKEMKRSKTGSARIRIFNAITGQEIGNPHDGGYFIVLSGDGTRFACKYDGITCVLGVNDLQIQFTLPLHNTGQLTFSNNNGLIAWDSVEETNCIGVREGILMISDGRTGANLFTLRGALQASTALSFSNDGKLLASAYADGTIRIWDCTRNAEWKRMPMLIEEGFLDIGEAIREYGAGYAVAAAGRISGEGGELIVIDGGGGSVTSLAWSPRGHTIAVGTENGNIGLWNIDTRAERLRLWKQNSCITCLAFSLNEEMIASACREGKICIWSVSKGELLMEFQAHQGEVTGLVFRPFLTFLISASNDRTIRFWDLRRAFTQFQRLVDEVNVDCLAISPDKDILALGLAGEAVIRLVRLSDWSDIGRISLQGDRIKTVAFSSDGFRILTVAIGLQAMDVNLVSIWELATKQCVYQQMDFEGKYDNVSHMKFYKMELVGNNNESILRFKGDPNAIIGWFPHNFHISTAMDQERLWAGISGGEIFVLSLEGDVTGNSIFKLNQEKLKSEVGERSNILKSNQEKLKSTSSITGAVWYDIYKPNNSMYPLYEWDFVCKRCGAHEGFEREAPSSCKNCGYSG